MIDPNDNIENRTRNPTVCSAVPQPNEPPLVRQKKGEIIELNLTALLSKIISSDHLLFRTWSGQPIWTLEVGGHFITYEVADTTVEGWSGYTTALSAAEGLETSH